MPFNTLDADIVRNLTSADELIIKLKKGSSKVPPRKPYTDIA
jgi:hypothetical protein